MLDTTIADAAGQRTLEGAGSGKHFAEQLDGTTDTEYRIQRADEGRHLLNGHRKTTRTFVRNNGLNGDKARTGRVGLAEYLNGTTFTNHRVQTHFDKVGSDRVHVVDHVTTHAIRAGLLGGEVSGVSVENAEQLDAHFLTEDGVQRDAFQVGLHQVDGQDRVTDQRVAAGNLNVETRRGGVGLTEELNRLVFAEEGIQRGRG